MPNIPSSRVAQGACQTFCSYDPSIVLPGNANGASSPQTCYIVVPYEHYLRAATFCCSEIANVGTVGAQLMVAADGAAKLGALVGTALTDTDLATVASLMKSFNIVLTDTEQGAVRAALTTWHMQLSGTNAGDLIKQPTLTICVEPTTRTRL